VRCGVRETGASGSMRKSVRGFLFSPSCWRLLTSGQAARTAQPLRGLDATVTKVEHAASASLRDCPPGPTPSTR